MVVEVKGGYVCNSPCVCLSVSLRVCVCVCEWVVLLMCRVRLWKWGDTVGDLTTGTRRLALATSILCDHPHHQ